MSKRIQLYMMVGIAMFAIGFCLPSCKKRVDVENEQRISQQQKDQELSQLGMVRYQTPSNWKSDVFGMCIEGNKYLIYESIILPVMENNNPVKCGN